MVSEVDKKLEEIAVAMCEKKDAMRAMSIIDNDKDLKREMKKIYLENIEEIIEQDGFYPLTSMEGGYRGGWGWIVNRMPTEYMITELLYKLGAIGEQSMNAVCNFSARDVHVKPAGEHEVEIVIDEETFGMTLEPTTSDKEIEKKLVALHRDAQALGMELSPITMRKILQTIRNWLTTGAKRRWGE